MRRTIISKALSLPKEQGLSLIELMVAITISLLIILALTTVFVNFSRSNREMAKSNAMIDNGRFALQLMQNDVVHAGFWGMYSPEFDNLTSTDAPSDVPSAVPYACDTFDPTATAGNAGYWSEQDKKNLVGIPLQTYDAVPTDEDGNPCAVVVNRVANTDVLLVRHAATVETAASGVLAFQPAQCKDEVPAFVLDSTDSNFTLTQLDCSTVAPKRKFVSNLYYVRNYADTPGDGIPTLVRSQFEATSGVYLQQAAAPLIEGIEGFQVELGIDSLSETGVAINYGDAVSWADESKMETATNRGDGAPDGAFVRCTTAAPCTASQLMNVTAIKIHVLARNLETTPGYQDTKTYELPGLTIQPSSDSAFDDAFKRHLFVTTVRLPNLIARRETP